MWGRNVGVSGEENILAFLGQLPQGPGSPPRLRKHWRVRVQEDEGRFFESKFLTRLGEAGLLRVRSHRTKPVWWGGRLHEAGREEVGEKESTRLACHLPWRLHSVQTDVSSQPCRLFSNGLMRYRKPLTGSGVHWVQAMVPSSSLPGCGL